MDKARNQRWLLVATIVAALSPMMVVFIFYILDSAGASGTLNEKIAVAPVFYLIACMMMAPFTLSFFVFYYLIVYLLLIRTILKVQIGALTQVCFFILTWTLAVFPGTWGGWAFYDQEFYVFYWALVSTSACYGVLLAVAIVRGFPRGKKEAGEPPFKIEPLS